MRKKEKTADGPCLTELRQVCAGCCSAPSALLAPSRRAERSANPLPPGSAVTQTASHHDARRTPLADRSGSMHQERSTTSVESGENPPMHWSDARGESC